MPAPGATALPLPAPKAATTSVPAPVVASAQAPVAPSLSASAAKPAPAVTVNRAPVPLVTRTHANYFPSSTIDGTAAGKSANGKPAVDTGKPGVDTGATTASSPSAETQQALLAEPKKASDSTGTDSKAKAAIELDGYKNVRGLVKEADGVWRGRAMRGRTEIAIRVNADGSVSAE